MKPTFRYAGFIIDKFRRCFITSQGDTAPKQAPIAAGLLDCFITSQGDTAPKREVYGRVVIESFINSQGDTAPKPLKQNLHCKGTFSLTDFDA